MRSTNFRSILIFASGVVGTRNVSFSRDHYYCMSVSRTMVKHIGGTGKLCRNFHWFIPGIVFRYTTSLFLPGCRLFVYCYRPSDHQAREDAMATDTPSLHFSVCLRATVDARCAGLRSGLGLAAIRSA